MEKLIKEKLPENLIEKIIKLTRQMKFNFEEVKKENEQNTITL